MKKKLGLTVMSLVLVAGTLLTGCSGAKPAASSPPAASKAPDGSSAPAPAAKAITLRLSDNQPPDYPTVTGDKKFAELVNQKSNGRIKIDVFPSSQLGEEKAVLEQVQLGAIDFVRVSTGPLGEFNKAFGVFSLPFIFDNEEHEWNFLQGPDALKLLESLSSSRMIGLTYYDSGARHFYTRKPVNTVADMKGLKIRVQQNKINVDLLAAMGASATPMNYGDVFGALQTGVIDGAENNYPSYFSSKHYEVAKNFILDGHQRVPEALVMSKASWDKLSDDDKKIVKQAAIDSQVTQRQAWKKYEKDSEDGIKAAGVTVVDVKDPKPWQDAVKPVIEKYRSEYKEVLDAIEKARKK